jgi:hypothetical protein
VILLEQLPGLHAAVALYDFVLQGLEAGSHDCADHGIVVDHENSHAR